MHQFSFLKHPTPHQVSQILGLYQSAGWWHPGPGDADQAVRIVAGSHCFLIAESAGDIIGMGRAVSDGVSDAYVQDVTVADAHRAQGLATGLVSRIVQRLQADGIDWIGLIAERNTQELYRRLGFAPMPNATPMLLNRS